MTGAGGFIGSVLVGVLEGASYRVRSAVRVVPTTPAQPAPSCGYFECGDIDAETDWREGLRDVTAVIHLAARAHLVGKSATRDSIAIRRAEVEATMHLAAAAVKQGVGRFIYLSSIKVNGEESDAVPFTAGDAPMPQGVYAESKFETEQALFRFVEKHDIKVTVVRPPLVYGPYAKGNFALLVRAVLRGMPLPLRAVKNKRSLVSVFNLCDLVRVCVDHPSAANEIFLVSDGDDVSTPEFVELIAEALHCRARLFPVPPTALKLAGFMTGRRQQMRRLCGNLQADITKTRDCLTWKPQLSIMESLRRSFMDGRYLAYVRSR